MGYMGGNGGMPSKYYEFSNHHNKGRTNAAGNASEISQKNNISKHKNYTSQNDNTISGGNY